MKPEVDPLFAHRVLETRMAVEWTVPDLARRSGLSADAISAIECDTDRVVTPAEADAIALAFGTTVEQMLLITRHTWRPPPNAPELGPVEDRPCAHLGCGRPRAEHRLGVAVEARR